MHTYVHQVPFTRELREASLINAPKRSHLSTAHINYIYVYKGGL
jgi:hypothetical protein